MICTIFCRNSAVVSRDQGRLALAAAAISSSSPSSASAPFEFRVTSTSGREIQDASIVPPREAPRVKREQFVPLELAEQKVRRLWSVGFPSAARQSARLFWVCFVLSIPISHRVITSFCIRSLQIAAMQRDAEQARERHQQQLRELDRQHQAVQRETRAHFIGLVEVRFGDPTVGEITSRDSSIRVSFSCSLEPVKNAFCLVLAFPCLQEVKSQARERDASNKELARWLVDESQQQVCGV
jgi:hypothetical protein